MDIVIVVGFRYLMLPLMACPIDTLHTKSFGTSVRTVSVVFLTVACFFPTRRRLSRTFSNLYLKVPPLMEMLPPIGDPGTRDDRQQENTGI